LRARGHKADYLMIMLTPKDFILCPRAATMDG
jgi:hypothetical protein